MIRTAPRLWWIVLGISVVVAIVYYCWAIPSSLSWILAGTAVLLVGIPHGAADHQLFSALYRARYGRLATWRFYVAYLGAIAAVGLGWWLFPRLTLLTFIALSAFHFGQANFHYLKQQARFTQVLSFTWGLWVVLTPIYFHWTSAAPILVGLWQAPLGAAAADLVGWVWATNSLGLLLAIIWLRRLTSWAEWLKECSVIGVLGILFYTTPLLVGFGLFFALWHALPSAGDQIRFFRRQYPAYQWYHYLGAVVPFAVLAIVGMLGLAWWLGTDANLTNWWSVIFGGIAALTLPHMVLLDRVYHKLQHHGIRTE